jgi:hypothetical protein
MNISPQLIDRIADLVRRRNRELAFDAVLRAGFGILFSCLSFAFVFWVGWYTGITLAPLVDIDAWLFGAVGAGFFIVVMTWLAWRRVDPFPGFEPLTKEQLVLTLKNRATESAIPLSPYRARTDMAMLLLGGPAGIFEAVGIWAHRLRADEVLIEEAARLLTLCKSDCPIEKVRVPAAAVLLRRLALIKVMPSGESMVLKLTDKGFALFGKIRDRPGS